MSYTAAPPAGTSYPAVPPPAPRKRTGLIVAAIAAAGLAAGGGIGAGLAASGGSTPSPAAASASAPAHAPASTPAVPPLTMTAAQIVTAVTGTPAQDGTTVTSARVTGTPQDDGATETASLIEEFSDGTAYHMAFTLDDASGNWSTHTGAQIGS